MLEADNPPLALALNPFNAEARVNVVLAGLNGNGSDLNAAREHAKALLRTAPGDARGYSLVGAIAERDGHEEQAAALYQIALDHSKTEIHALLRLTDKSLAEADIGAALGYIDLILRRWPLYWDQIIPVLEAAVRTEDGRALLASTLHTDPPWRRRALIALSATTPGLVFARDLLQSEGPATTSAAKGDVAATVAALARHGAFGDAHTLFLASLPSPERELAGYVFDPEFTGIAAGGYFAWQARSDGSADIKMPSQAGGLTVRFMDSPAKLGTVGQTLRLPMGRYRFEVALEAVQLAAPRRLYWHLECLGGAGSLTEVDVPEGSYGMSLLDADLEVPQSGCPAQRLSLRTDIRTDSWRDRYRGEVRFSALRITRH
ncbi:hypothetical protein EMQ25_11605 [Arsenicitalea aurantiaca]|uniref:Tetratricopeptide repeat protein n=1 Tax=Arsenicitalea aurantiaca TaxID=1783274 RepID=A0A433X7E4_9HYPH|nr:hypothetical protein [Arsenicitalea aurantiaca]RUT29979.1 hypothetical protein EMQ25_11605 [Arsenicitalea aurantiaca]